MSTTVPTVVVAPDKFKGSLTAAEAAAAIASGIREVAPDANVIELPIADGGDGTVAAAIAGGWRRVDVTAENAVGELHETCFARKGSSAIVELAQVCGLVGLGDRRDPMGAGTEGLGTVIMAAIEDGARDIVIALGGSASTDGGAGMLRRMGAVTVGTEQRGGGALVDIEHLDLRGLPRFHNFVLAADVDNPLLGPRGAAAVFGRQKGADDQQIRQLEVALAHWGRLVARAIGRDYSVTPGSGAAGGAGLAVLGPLEATRRSGAGIVFEIIQFGAKARGASLVITGEGSLDEQTLSGKGPAEVARRAPGAIAVCGANSLSDRQLRDAGFGAVYPLSDLEPDPSRSMSNAAALLQEIGARIARDQLPPKTSAVRGVDDNY